MKRISEQIADWLVEHGVEQVFTVTGGGAMFLNQAIGGHSQLRTVFMHHEQACAMAAEGYARISGKPAVVMLTTGPGSINALNGVYGAFTDSIPMIVISGQAKRETCLSFYDLPELRQLGDQEGPTIAMASPVCKYAQLVRSEQDLETMLPAAFVQAVSGRPGPVWLDIPLDIQQSTQQINIPAPVWPAQPVNDALRADCHTIIQKLRAAHRPLVLGGTGVRLSKTEARVLALIEKLGIPLATAWTHDLIASDHPLFAGRPGTIGTRAGNFCLQNADFVLVLGSRLNIRQTSYNWSTFARNAWVAQVDIDAAELRKPTVQVDLGVAADLGVFLDVLEQERASVQLPSYQPWADWCHKIGQTYNAANEHVQKPGAPLNPYVMVDRIFKAMRPDDIVVSGNASACILPFQVGTLQKGQRLFSNSGSASMGHDLPAALGASTATFDQPRRVICFAGDGSIQMNIQELQTLKTLGANVVIVVLNNAGYLSIWQTHENFFGRVIGATPATGVEFPDFCAVARAYGLKAASIWREADLPQLDELLLQDGPLLIDLHVDPRQEFAPRIKSRVDENGKFFTPELDDMHPFLEQSVVEAVRAEAAAIKAIGQ
ncbi:thiamine pyrophosphate-binding protein [Amantichitinum ursilacus]|uniref:Acetolactate synthase isozyme 1 large subunit n=1 Tax=Amantichitinum ursilacus TaxID=857265 RepID=A0A0N1JSJ2_9NEIS|nr:thiamine pyrophosphate-binding protein [Amantichitinum ursilacus]KPC52258.1 Acetolactate synthase isozyme 1 large subunit [Amantichitinum ursilacus]